MTLGVVLLAVALGAGEARGLSGCPPGVDPQKYVCLSLEEAAKIRIDQIDLEEENAILKARKRRFGFHFGCGVGVGAIINAEWDAKLAPVPGFCGAVYGF